MKYLLISVLAGMLMSSCSMAYLDRYPGVKQDSIPPSFRGSYYLKLKSQPSDPSDSIWIGIYDNRWEYIEGKKKVSYELSNDKVISKVGRYYVLSMKDETLRDYWSSWVILPKKKDIELYPVITISQPHSDKLSQYLEKKYAGIHQDDSVYFYQMNDEAFVKYFEKVIKGSKTFTIIRINGKRK